MTTPDIQPEGGEWYPLSPTMTEAETTRLEDDYERQYVHGLALAVLYLADINNVELSAEIIDSMRDAESVVGAQRIATEAVGGELAQRAVNQLRADVHQQRAFGTPPNFADRLSTYRRARDNSLAEARVMDELVKLERGRNDIKHDKATDTWWVQTVQGSNQWYRVDPITFASNLDNPGAAFVLGDNGQPDTKIESVDWGFPEFVDQQEQEPFGPYGRIPSWYRSNRVIGEDDFLSRAGMGDPYEQAFQDVVGFDSDAHFATPQYRPYDHISLFAGLDAVELAGWQNMMIDAGYLKASDIAGQHGLWMESSYDAMAQAMIDADHNGYDITEWLDRTAEFRANMSDEEKAQAAGIRPFVAPAYRAPDYATLAAEVRGTVQQKLGRPVRDYEMSMLSKELAEWDRQAYNAEVSARRSEYDAGNRAILEETSQSAGTVRAVDPTARLMEMIETRYAGEIETDRRVNETYQNARHLMNLLGGISGSI